MIRKKLKIEELWQSKYATWLGRREAHDNTLPNTIHLGVYTIRFKGKIIGDFYVDVVNDGVVKAKIYISRENKWPSTPKKRKGEWTKVTRIRLDTIKEVTCSVIGTHSISACSGCKYRKAWTDHHIDCACLDVKCNPEGSCDIIRVKA